ncbi:MAG TPA: hypothetical protein VGE66_12320 [Chitinophagaceae bacterium]
MIKRLLCFLVLTLLAGTAAWADTPRTTISLNGTWEFEQTTSAFPPPRFSRTIPVPGLVHLATPRIEEYEKFFRRPEKAEHRAVRNILAVDYTPRYSWYRKKLVIEKERQGQEAVLTINKSQYVTQVFVNGIDLGSYIECYTPIEVAITRALKWGEENEILVKVGDRYWLPSEAAGGTDKEKEHYLPGIWDDVSLSFTNGMRVSRLLVLPVLQENKVTVKAKLWNLERYEVINKDPRVDTVHYGIKLYEKKGRRAVGEYRGTAVVRREAQGEVSVEMSLADPHPWTPEDPFLYTAELTVGTKTVASDAVEKAFGMRDFERRGKFFYLNGQKQYLRGSNITLQRFFEDPECSNLAWDRAWVKKMLIDIPKELDWNSMRICVSVVPDFWYDLADEHGLLLQNEWLYWQSHGWNEQVRKEYTDWVWADGSHPSIAIWDAINENWDEYIGNTLIPELKKLDPTRIWDAGYMTADHMGQDDMDEPHTYQGRGQDIRREKKPYPLGDLGWRPAIVRQLEKSDAAQLVNEYGWVWLWRDGTPSKLTTAVYNHYLGNQHTVEQRRAFQAYWLQCETEWMRSNRSIAGVLAFCLLTNNYGYTGDWFTGKIEDLAPSPTLYWFRHCFAATNVFIDLPDGRYAQGQPVHTPGASLGFGLMGVNDAPQPVDGTVTVRLRNAQGRAVHTGRMAVTLPATERTELSYAFTLPKEAGGYLLETEFVPKGKGEPRLSRRYLKVGQLKQYHFYEPQVREAAWALNLQPKNEKK